MTNMFTASYYSCSHGPFISFQYSRSTHAFFQAVDFSVPFWEESLGVLVRTEDNKKLFTAFKPFSWWLWLVLLVVLLSTAVCLRLLGCIMEHIEGTCPVACAQTLSRSLGYCFRVCLSQGKNEAVTLTENYTYNLVH